MTVEAIDRFAEEFESKHPKAAECLRSDQDQLSVHFDFPAEHWKHLRTTNIIESPLSTVRLRQRVTKGAASRAKALLMAFKLIDMAQQRWRNSMARSCCHWSAQASASSMEYVRRGRRRLPSRREKAA